MRGLGKWFLNGLAGLALTTNALAGCLDGLYPEEVRQAFQEGQAHEKAGRQEQAVLAYVRAQTWACGQENPVEHEAARRAAPLALKLGQAAESRRKWVAPSGREEDHKSWGAYEWYERGGHFAAADRALMNAVKAQPEDFGLFDRAYNHFQNRSLEAFQSNEQVRLSVTGAYQLDPALYAAFKALPGQQVDRLLAQESAQFKEAFLSEYQTLIRQRPAPGDLAAMQQAYAAEQAFRSKWRQDPLQASSEALDLVGVWIGRMDENSEPYRDKLNRRALERGSLLLKKYADVPQLLEKAIEYFSRADAEDQVLQAQRQAGRQGDLAMKEGRFELASAFYQLAGDYERAEQAESRMAQQNESLAAAHRERYMQQAGPLMEFFENPENVKAMQRQAEEMMRAAEQQRESFLKEQQALEEELGL